MPTDTLDATFAALADPTTIALALLGGAVLLWFPINSAWLVVAGGVIGMLASASGLR